MKTSVWLASLPFALSALSVSAQDLSDMQQCLLDKMNTTDAQTTVADIRASCEQQLRAAKDNEVVEFDAVESEPGALTRRVQSEEVTQFDPYVLTPHRRNYMLPVLSSNNINRIQYAELEGYRGNLEDYEAKFQMSFKVPFNKESLLFEGDKLFFGFTVQSWWQIYSDNISKPFRETNYMPEFFYATPTGWHPLGTNTALVFGAEHLSNGRSQPLSRSWNRFYAQLIVEKGDFVFSVKPWIRLQEDAKSDPLEASGDDNPNIEDYVGNYEFSTAYSDGDFEYIFRLKHAIETGRGSAELNWTFPLWGKFIGYTSLFTGYGESLIDYNHKQTRFGIGIALNNVL
ncbi:phospholipase A [Idiomarina seosinensis]|uniref:Phospholipase A1 n=1 Tax=Idiomarina seosinensis TaxID=281739 RepID=A0A432Z6Q6_9GAMM|nr:phospholipase A [Idiomarina seosinensis]RUO73598.1 phospholipase [Idiomarina seosinensis]